MFRRPTIQKIVADELYHTQRLLLDAEAKHVEARVVERHHAARVEFLQQRCTSLKGAIAPRVPCEHPSAFDVEAEPAK